VEYYVRSLLSLVAIFGLTLNLYAEPNKFNKDLGECINTMKKELIQSRKNSIKKSTQSDLMTDKEKLRYLTLSSVDLCQIAGTCWNSTTNAYKKNDPMYGYDLNEELWQDELPDIFWSWALACAENGLE
jgi:hypothetical protein